MTPTLIPIARLLLTLSLAAGSPQASVAIPAEPVVMAESKPEPLVTSVDVHDQSELLWLARAIFSETKDEHEMVLIGCVIKNRVLSGYRGTTYKEVILAPGQFSGFLPSDPQYALNTSLTFASRNLVWQKAVTIAEQTYKGEISCPISEDVRHFYSPISATRTPSWAHGEEPVLIVKRNDNELARFMLYENIK